MSEEKLNEAEVKNDGSENIDKPDESGDKVDAPEVDSEIDKASESVMNELSKKDKKREDKQLREENRKLTAKNKELGDSLEKAQKEHDELQDKYLRVCAEYDNFRKRTQGKERDGIFTDAYSDALKEILPIFDNLERAALYTEPDKLTEGLELIFKSAEMLSKLGVEEFGAVGEKFDPNIHNAVMHIEDESVGEEEIIEVFQKGYKRGDKIIRHAMVKVAN